MSPASYRDRILADYYGDDEPRRAPACRGSFCSHEDCDGLWNVDEAANPYTVGDRVGVSTVLDVDGDSVLLSGEDDGGAAWVSVAECDAMVRA